MAYSFTKETATTYCLHVLRRWPDREIQIVELFSMCGGKYHKENLQNALTRLLDKGYVNRETDPNRAAWWSITDKGLSGEPE
ncbi:MAG: hypothetical protein FJ100_15085 [Deltaproteobacteria bacterium]|nr:hypothetical protein [Deltaproteobacteria bacterium]